MNTHVLFLSTLFGAVSISVAAPIPFVVRVSMLSARSMVCNNCLCCSHMGCGFPGAGDNFFACDTISTLIAFAAFVLVSRIVLPRGSLKIMRADCTWCLSGTNLGIMRGAFYIFYVAQGRYLLKIGLRSRSRTSHVHAMSSRVKRKGIRVLKGTGWGSFLWCFYKRFAGQIITLGKTIQRHRAVNDAARPQKTNSCDGS